MDANNEQLRATWVLEPATETELIHYVKEWVKQDEEVDISEWMTVEEMMEGLREAVVCRPPENPISDARLREIVSLYAPNAPHRSNVYTTQPEEQSATPETSAQAGSLIQPKLPQPPAELLPLVSSGIAIYESEHWFVKRCRTCGNFRADECCSGKTERVSAVRSDGITLTSYARQAAGLEPIRRPEPPKPVEQTWTERPWWKSFCGADELEDGGIKMYIENFLAEGITLICGLPKEGKTYLALSIVKALTTGRPLFGKAGFEVPEPIPVLYLAAEVSDRAFKKRLRTFNITADKTRFLCRTLTKGPRLGLRHEDIEAVVRAMKPIIIVDTVVRFNGSSDEDSATENQKLADDLFYLRSLGARAIIGLHHSRKDLKEGEPTLEKAVRGSGDMSAMCDAVWALIRDERLYQNNRGPNEVEVVGWGRDFNAAPMRLALTKRAPKDLPNTVITFAPGILSVIDESGDLGWVDKAAANKVTEVAEKTVCDRLEQIVQDDPKTPLRKLAQTVGLTYWQTRNTLKSRGWTRGRGYHAVWKQTETTVQSAA